MKKVKKKGGKHGDRARVVSSPFNYKALVKTLAKKVKGVKK
jgi:hypothetical protein